MHIQFRSQAHCLDRNSYSGRCVRLKTVDGTNLQNVHFRWTPSNKPVQTVKPGEEFRVIVPDSSTMQMQESYTTEDLGRIDAEKFDGAVGPIYVEGAEPGDTLEVNIIKLKVGTWGWTAVLSNFGFLAGKYPEALIIWDLEGGVGRARGGYLKDIEIPLIPFLGVVGVAPEEGEYGMIPPQYFGGNMDNRLLREGSSLFLPVSVKGALLSFSDPHGAQGDGEVCGTAIETSADVIASVKVHKSTGQKFPKLVSQETFSGKELVVMGIGPDLKEATRNAVTDMITHLQKYGLSGTEAYALCSVAGNLRISEIVDEPNYVVSVILPEKLIEKRMN